MDHACWDVFQSVLLMDYACWDVFQSVLLMDCACWDVFQSVLLMHWSVKLLWRQYLYHFHNLTCPLDNCTGISTLFLSFSLIFSFFNGGGGWWGEGEGVCGGVCVGGVGVGFPKFPRFQMSMTE